MVTSNDVFLALKRLGVENGDILLFHSSLKSFGQVDGGADAIIDGVLKAVGDEGTAIVPTLVQRDFANAYKNWDVNNTPSDVGLITETFRKRPNAFRSNQATHSVAAIGKMAKYITEGHTDFGPQYSIFGDYAFAKSSAWQKMYDLRGKVLFMGCDLRANTFRHFAEARICTECIDSVRDEVAKKELLSQLSGFDQREEFIRQYDEQAKTGKKAVLVYPFLNGGLSMQEELINRGLAKETICGASHFILFSIHDMVDEIQSLVEEAPTKWIGTKQSQDWYTKAKRLANNKAR